MTGALMRTAWIEDVGAPLRTGKRQRPEPGPGEVVVAVRAAGVCHTDLHLRDGVPAPPPLPLVPGHEIAGDVVVAGADVDLPVGSRVLVYYYDGCGQCSACKAGEENLCPAPKAKWGFDTDGGYAEFVTVAARCCVVLPTTVGYADAAVMGCSGTTALHASRAIAQLHPHETVVVIGAGGIGLAVIQVALLDGARVFAVDTDSASLEQARRLGAGTDVPARVDVVIDTVGNERTPAMGVEMLRTGGRLVLIGYTGLAAQVDVARIVTGEIIVRGSVGATLGDAREAVRLLAAGQLRAVISRRLPLAETNQALSLLEGGGVVGRIVLEP